jgi:AcrR family transcriptional regulator
MSTAESTRIGRPRSTPSASVGTAREEILDAAAALFAERGYAGTSTRAIAERVGIRQASLYYHFAGKDEILLDLLEISVRPSLDVVDRLRDAGDPAAALYALAAVDVDTLAAAPHNIGSLYFAHEVDEPRFDSFRRHRAQLQQGYAELARAVDPDGDTAFLGACCMQLVEMVIPLRRDAEIGSGTADAIARACLRLVGADPSAATGGARLLEQLLTDRG